MDMNVKSLFLVGTQILEVCVSGSTLLGRGLPSGSDFPVFRVSSSTASARSYPRLRLPAATSARSP